MKAGKLWTVERSQGSYGQTEGGKEGRTDGMGDDNTLWAEVRG